MILYRMRLNDLQRYSRFMVATAMLAIAGCGVGNTNYGTSPPGNVGGSVEPTTGGNSVDWTPTVTPGASGNSHQLPNYIWEPLVKTFERQARGIPVSQWKALATKYLANPRTPVRVATVDFSVDQPIGRSRSGHKEAVTGVIRNLLCVDAEASECRSRVMATPGISADEGARREHDYLTFENFYSSVLGILNEWQPKNENRIINVGVAWDPIKMAIDKSPIDDPRVAPVYQLLRRASCMGAIVIAPAGNATGSEGPLFPAGYEVERAPSKEECAKMGIHRRKDINDEKTPLVYAVGALDSGDQRMVTVRRWGQPRLAAYGLSVPAYGSKGERLMFSGTSMSTAVVSAAAAAVWSAKPDLSSDQVMAIVYEGGVKLDGGFASKRARTEFCLEGPFGPCPDAVRRVFLCGALEKVLPPEAGLSCVNEPTDPKSAALPSLPGEAVPPALPSSRVCEVTNCGHTFGPSVDQIPNGAVPQPLGIAGCPGCTLSLPRAMVFGSLTWDSALPPAMLGGVVSVWTRRQTNPAYSTTVWDVTRPFEVHVYVPSDTYGAMLTVSFTAPDGTPAYKDIPLNVNFYQ